MGKRDPYELPHIFRESGPRGYGVHWKAPEVVGVRLEMCWLLALWMDQWVGMNGVVRISWNKWFLYIGAKISPRNKPITIDQSASVTRHPNIF